MKDAWKLPGLDPPVRVLRIRWRHPLTLGHVLLLEELDSPVIRGEEFHLGDLSLAVLVCSEPTAAAARRQMRSPFAWLGMRYWGWRCRGVDFGSECQVFIAWLTAQVGGPSRKVKLPEGQLAERPLAAPWPISRLAAAVGELGLSRAEAQDMPLRELTQLLCALSELRGGSEYWTESEEQRLDAILEEDRLAAVPASNGRESWRS